jgi:autotransporter-associated beta strand protein
MKFSNPRFGGGGWSPQGRLALLCCGAAGFASIRNASAAIVYSGGQTIAITQDFEGVFINVTDFQSDAAASSTWDLNPFFGGLGIANAPGFQPVRIGTGNEDPILALALGASVGGSSTFASGWGGSGVEDDSGHLGPGAGQFTAGQTGYLGFKLLRGNAVNYGWMRVNLTRNDVGGAVLDWAYDDAGNSILTGAVADLGATPLVYTAGSDQTLSASQAGSGLLMEEGAKITFNEGSQGGAYAGNIQGAGEIVVAGAGGLRLAGDNSFSGTASVLEGSRLTVGEAGNLGTAQIKISSSGSLEFDSLAANNGSANTFANAISLDGQAATLNNSGSGKVVLAGSIASNGGLLGFTGGSFDVLGDITGAGSLRKEGSGTLTLTGANTFTGSTSITGGKVSVSSDANLGTAPEMATANQLGLNGGTLSVSSGFTLNSNREIAVGPASGTGSGTIEVASSQTLTYGGIIANNGNGTGGLTKDSAGKLTLTGTSTYTGATLVSAGTMLVNGALSGTSGVSVSSGATLGGTGSITHGVTVVPGATLSPGASIESLGLGSLDLDGSLLIEWDTTALPYIDLLNIASTLNLGSNSSVIFTNLGAGSLDLNTPYIFATYGPGGLTGTFKTVSNLPVGFILDYNYGGLNQIAVVPEPSGLLLTVIFSLPLLSRRRRSPWFNEGSSNPRTATPRCRTGPRSSAAVSSMPAMAMPSRQPVPGPSSSPAAR